MRLPPIRRVATTRLCYTAAGIVGPSGPAASCQPKIGCRSLLPKRKLGFAACLGTSDWVKQNTSGGRSYAVASGGVALVTSHGSCIPLPDPRTHAPIRHPQRLRFPVTPAQDLGPVHGTQHLSRLHLPHPPHPNPRSPPTLPPRRTWAPAWRRWRWVPALTTRVWVCGRPAARDGTACRSSASGGLRMQRCSPRPCAAHTCQDWPSRAGQGGV